MKRDATAAPDLIALIRETKQEIARLQGILAGARAELDGDSPRAAERSVRRRTPSRRVSAQADASTKRRRRRHNSTVALAQSVLSGTDEMHVDDLVAQINERFKKAVSKQTLVGNLARLVKAGEIFERTAPNTYALRKAG